MKSEIEIMKLTGFSFLVDYSGQAVPQNYICACCGKRGRQWRRREDNRIGTELYCVICKTEMLGEDAVPAIPVPDNTAYWRFEEISKEASNWWIRLPSQFKQRH